MTKETQIVQVLRWQNQEVEEQLAWLTGVKGVTDTKQLQAYEAGLRHGFLKAYNLLSLHGMLSEHLPRCIIPHWTQVTNGSEGQEEKMTETLTDILSEIINVPAHKTCERCGQNLASVDIGSDICSACWQKWEQSRDSQRRQDA